MSRKSRRRSRASTPVEPPVQTAAAAAAPKARNPLVWNPLLQKGGVHKATHKSQRRRQKVALQRWRDEQSRHGQVCDRDGFAHRVDGVVSVNVSLVEPALLARRCSRLTPLNTGLHQFSRTPCRVMPPQAGAAA